MPELRFIYWDANIFLYYINNDPDNIPTIEAILEEVEKDKQSRIVTSVISKVEVAWAATEKLKRNLDSQEEDRIDSLWNDPSVIEMIDFSDEVALRAREFMREGMVKGWRLRPMDAIHLASAEWIQAVEVQTYDLDRLQKYSELIGMPIQEPYVNQAKLL